MKYLSFFFLILFVSGCITPGIYKRPIEKPVSKKNTTDYSIEDVKLEIIEINKLTLTQVGYYNEHNQINNLDYSIDKFPEIYDYHYEYSLGSSDKISINLTDTDELDNVYTLDPDGNIDLPFVGTVNIGDLTLNDAKKTLLTTLQKFYKNPELQIEISEYNSSKIYVLGAVKNQLAINLDEKPIRLIDAAIQANYSPNSRTKNRGNRGILRRDNKVYKVNLNNVFQDEDDKENFFLKKNDVLFVDNNIESLHVFGEINKPGIYYPNKSYSITELLSEAGLNNLTADAENIYILRESYDEFLKINIFQLDIKNPVNLIVGSKFLLKSKDIIFIPPAPIVRWNRIISLMIPQTDLFNSYNPIIQNGVKQGANVNQTN